MLASIHTGCSAPASRAPGSGRWLWVPGGALTDKEGARWDQGTEFVRDTEALVVFHHLPLKTAWICPASLMCLF